ncbi:MAG: TetR/AcrR family transcriptional regulator [Candidatus Binatia bacterium]
MPAPMRREQLLDAAVEAFAEHGFRGASTANIAARLGVSEPTLFRHFPSKRALYLAAIDRSADQMIAQWRAIAADCATPLEALLEVGRWYFAELQRDSRHLVLRFRSYGEATDPEVGERVRAHFREVFAFVQDLHERARSAGLIDANTDTAARTWLFMAIGTLLDATQILGLRDDLRLEDMPGLMMAAMPSLAHPPQNPRGDDRAPEEVR